MPGPPQGIAVREVPDQCACCSVRLPVKTLVGTHSIGLSALGQARSAV